MGLGFHEMYTIYRKEEYKTLITLTELLLKLAKLASALSEMIDTNVTFGHNGVLSPNNNNFVIYMSVSDKEYRLILETYDEHGTGNLEINKSPITFEEFLFDLDMYIDETKTLID